MHVTVWLKFCFASLTARFLHSLGPALATCLLLCSDIDSRLSLYDCEFQLPLCSSIDWFYNPVWQNLRITCFIDVGFHLWCTVLKICLHAACFENKDAGLILPVIWQVAFSSTLNKLEYWKPRSFSIWSFGIGRKCIKRPQGNVRRRAIIAIFRRKLHIQFPTMLLQWDELLHDFRYSPGREDASKGHISLTSSANMFDVPCLFPKGRRLLGILGDQGHYLVLRH